MLPIVNDFHFYRLAINYDKVSISFRIRSHPLYHPFPLHSLTQIGDYVVLEICHQGVTQNIYTSFKDIKDISMSCKNEMRVEDGYSPQFQTLCVLRMKVNIYGHIDVDALTFRFILITIIRPGGAWTCLIRKRYSYINIYVYRQYRLIVTVLNVSFFHITFDCHVCPSFVCLYKSKGVFI